MLVVQSRRAIKVLKCDHKRVRVKCYSIVLDYMKTNKGPKQFIASPTKERDMPSNSKTNGQFGEKTIIRIRNATIVRLKVKK